VSPRFSGAAPRLRLRAMECRCTEADEFAGAEAEAYLAEHLQADSDGTYSCPDTGARWRVDEETDPAQQRLVRV
jgi:hypothetical protein